MEFFFVPHEVWLKRGSGYQKRIDYRASLLTNSMMAFSCLNALRKGSSPQNYRFQVSFKRSLFKGLLPLKTFMAFLRGESMSLFARKYRVAIKRGEILSIA